MIVSAHSKIQSYQCRHALLLYGDHNSAHFVSAHAVSHEQEDGQLRLLAGVPASQEAIMALCHRLMQSVAARPCWLPARCLCAGDRHLMWWTERSTRRMFMSCQELGEREALIAHPPLLWVVDRHRWRVFALADNERPTLTTPLYHAPFFNIDNAGQICTGSAALPKSTAPDSIDAWEAAFFCSTFTHPNGSVERCTHPRGLYALWQALLDGEYPVFPTALLQPCQGSVGGLLASIQTGGPHD